MERVSDGFISFSKAQAKDAREHACPGCPIDCSGPDSKTNTADVKSTIAQNLSDEQIAATAPCLMEAETRTNSSESNDV
jgi:hypothetical protein